MTNDKSSNIALLSLESARAEITSLEDFVDEFDSQHDNRRIRFHLKTGIVFWSPSHLSE